MPGKLEVDNGIIVDCIVDGSVASHTIGASTTILWILHLNSTQLGHVELNRVVNFTLHDDDGVDKQVVGRVVRCEVCREQHAGCTELRVQRG